MNSENAEARSAAPQQAQAAIEAVISNVLVRNDLSDARVQMLAEAVRRVLILEIRDEH